MALKPPKPSVASKESWKPEFVFVLGAGASISATEGKMPGIDGVFSKAALIGNDEDAYPTWAPYLNNVLIDYCRERFGVELYASDVKINAEELLTDLEVDLERRNGDVHLASALRNAIEVIGGAIYAAGSEKLAQDCAYGLFANLVENYGFPVITFNWDTLLDGLLSDSIQHDALYEIISNRRPYEFDEQALFPGGVYLKLHGSVHWLICRSNRQCPLRNVEIQIGTLSSRRIESRQFCRGCGGGLEMLIVPPTSKKAIFDQLSVQMMWNAATQVLGRAKDLVIWGYSLPPSDFVSRWLFRHVGVHLRSLTVIDPNHSEVMRRFRSVIVSGKKREVEFEAFESFRDWYERHAK